MSSPIYSKPITRRLLKRRLLVNFRNSLRPSTYITQLIRRPAKPHLLFLLLSVRAVGFTYCQIQSLRFSPTNKAASGTPLPVRRRVKPRFERELAIERVSDLWRSRTFPSPNETATQTHTQAELRTRRTRRRDANVTPVCLMEPQSELEDDRGR